MPVAFGPDQSLCPTIATAGLKPTFHTTSIRFLTSRTLIKNLLPPEVAEFSFDMPGTLATCSFVWTSFKNVAWLQGGSRNTLALYINGVSHKGSSGQQSRGAYVPVLFENLPYTVVRDREVYGLPAFYSEITAELRPNSSQVTAKAQGHSWLTLTLEDLKPGSVPTSPASSTALFPDGASEFGLLSWRSVPKFSLDGAEQPADVDAFAVKLSVEDEGREIQIQQVYESSKASIQFAPQDSKQAHALGPIVQRLAEIPIYQILGAKVVVGNGTPAFKQASRI